MDSQTFFELLSMLLIISLIMWGKAAFRYDNPKKYTQNDVDFSKFKNDDTDGFKNFFGTTDMISVKRSLFKIFVNAQLAYCDFDEGALKKLCTDELFSAYKSKAMILKMKNEKTIMKDFRPLETKIYSVTETNGYLQLDVFMHTSYIEYVIDIPTKLLIKGYKRTKRHNYFVMTFIKKIDDEEIECPGCGAKVKNHNTTCEFCRTRIISVANDFIISRKNNINIG